MACVEEEGRHSAAVGRGQRRDQRVVISGLCLPAEVAAGGSIPAGLTWAQRTVEHVVPLCLCPCNRGCNPIWLHTKPTIPQICGLI